MKTLYLIRHAKSSWNDLSCDDFDRPLNKRGKRDAPFMGELLADNEILPDIIYSSPAKRTTDTAKIIAKKIGYTKEIIFDQRIYESNLIILIRLIKEIDNYYESAFFFGHNPILNLFVEEYGDFDENIPTCGIVKLVFECDKWEQITPANCEFLEFEYPKKYLIKKEK
jgi:phosphohistidine phosphatase